ncbi:hypothetical protein BX070DRAFT_187214 [Coemansia spiralis]|nr:hypothetical protein BX070DRAFT_187214 [Coemansia spiralis]
MSADGNTQSSKLHPEDIDRAEDVQVDNDQSKFSAILGILRRVIGVTDVISLRLSLPSQLLDPIPNLEYWNYMDRPEYFAAIPESDDEVERMLAVLAWWFSKLLKHKDRIQKPFNSILGEQFFCRWDLGTAAGSSSERESTAASSITDVSVGSDSAPAHVEYITEQVSHHPPVSAFVYRCPERGVEAVGLDHICAKFTGLSATVAPGSECKGIFVTLKSRNNETYKSIHPTANIVGWLRGNLKVQLAETSYIMCPQTKLAAIIQFKEERWFGKNNENVTGKVFKYDPETQGDAIASWRLKDIPKNCALVATFSGCWDKKVNVLRVDGDKSKQSEPRTLIDLTDLKMAEKTVKPLEEQGEMESRRVWDPVATKMIQGKFSEATKLKRGLEERQRALAAERKANGQAFSPALFKPDYSATGKPELLDTAPLNL